MRRRSTIACGRLGKINCRFCTSCATPTASPSRRRALFAFLRLLLFLFQKLLQISKGTQGFATFFHRFGNGLYLLGLCGRSFDGLGMLVVGPAPATLTSAAAAIMSRWAVTLRWRTDSCRLWCTRSLQRRTSLARARRALRLRSLLLRPLLRSLLLARRPFGAGRNSG